MLSFVTKTLLLASTVAQSHSKRFGTIEGMEYKIPSCQDTPFCNRNQHLQKEFLNAYQSNQAIDFYYSLDPTTIAFNNTAGSITAKLNLACSDPTQEIAPELDLTLWFYQNGIMRTLLEEPDSTRFRISQEGLPVVEE